MIPNSIYFKQNLGSLTPHFQWPPKNISPHPTRPYFFFFFLVITDTHTCHNQLKSASFQFFSRLLKNRAKFGILFKKWKKIQNSQLYHYLLVWMFLTCLLEGLHIISSTITHQKYIILFEIIISIKTHLLMWAIFCYVC